MERLAGKTKKELADIVAQAGLPSFAADQLARWLYGPSPAASIAGMTNLSATARRWLSEHLDLGWDAPVEEVTAGDGTVKYLFEAGENAWIEAAVIPDEDRATLCLSTQAGCRMGCAFCGTARQGFQANLTAGQIVNQYHSVPQRKAITNIVYMGMGEPLDNLRAVLDSLEIFTAPWGMGMSPTRLTVSSVGVLPALKTLLEDSRVHIALSLHSPFEDERQTLMPVQRAHPLVEVLAVLRSHAWEPQRRLMIEYILFGGLNDTARHARELVRVLNGLSCTVNLLRYHPVPGTPFVAPSDEAVLAFQGLLKEKGVMTTVRRSRGHDISAACGLLSTRRKLAEGGVVPNK